METFADVLHALIDTVFTGDIATKAHTIIDGASGPRTTTEAPAEEAPAAEAPAAEATTVPGADEAPEEAPPTPGG